MALRKKHLDYIEYIKTRTGLSLSALAKAAGLADSTLTRFTVKKDFKRLSTATLDKLSKVAGFESYENYLVETHQLENETLGDDFRIEDAQKFELYESVKRLLAKKFGNAKPMMVSNVSQNVLAHAYKLRTDFISDSLIMYVIERMETEGRL